MKLIIGILIAVACFGQGKQNVTQTGLVDAHAANWIPPHTTFAIPPSSPAVHSVYIFEDASALGACTGGGTFVATCEWTGSAWTPTGGSSTGGTVTSVTAGTHLASSGGTTPNITGDFTAIAVKYFGTSAPGSVSGNLPGDTFYDTTGHQAYYCGAPAGTSAPACTSVTTGGWTAQGGGGGSYTPPVTTKGDLFGYSTVPARIAVGADTYCLTADSTQALGVRWAPCAAGGTNVNADNITIMQTSYTNSTHLAVNAFGNVGLAVTSGTPTTYHFASSETITLSGGATDTLREYVDSAGTLTVASNTAALACTGVLVCVTGITAFPQGSTPLYQWPIVSGAFSTIPSTPNPYDFRPFISGNLVLGAGGGGGGSGVQCDTATVPYTTLTAAGAVTSVEVPMSALVNVPGTTRYGEVTLSETTQFVGSGVTGLTVSMGRTGSNASEMSGATPSLMVSSGDANFWAFQPAPPVLTGNYSPILKFVSTGGNLNALTAGVLTWRVCHY